MTSNRGDEGDGGGGPETPDADRCQALLTILHQLSANGIEVDKNLRQPSYYSRIEADELAAETFATISDLLNSRRLPLWLAQRIAWFYTKKHRRQIEQDLDASVSVTRDKMVAYLRASIPDVIKAWLNERLDDHKSRLFSLDRSIVNDQVSAGPWSTLR